MNGRDFFWAASHNLNVLVEYYKRVSRLLQETSEQLKHSEDSVKRENAKKYGEIYPSLFLC